MMAAMILSVYPNCSKGGMTTVYRTRANTLGENHHFLFQNDRGGRPVFEEMGADYRIMGPGKFDTALEFSAKHVAYDEVRITASPTSVGIIGQSFSGRVVYEFHTSSLPTIDEEITHLDFDVLDEIWTPSDWLLQLVRRRVPDPHKEKCRTVPNIVDTRIFHSAQAPMELDLHPSKKPLVWLGRFDKGKNVNDFFRVVSMLGSSYFPIIVVSFESEPDRVAKALAEARAYGLVEQTQVFLNLSQAQLAGLYVWARQRGGAFVSTSLAESFGYGVAESVACGLATIAYRVGGIPEVPLHGADTEFVAVGDIDAMADSVARLTRHDDGLRGE